MHTMVNKEDILMNLDRVIAVRTSKTVYRDENKAIKVFDKDYSKSDILNEALNQARVEETELNIPNIIEVTKIDEKWAIVSDYISGKTLEQLMKEHPEKNNEYLESFIVLQIKVHSQKSPLLNKLKDKMLRKISETDLEATNRYDLQTRLEGMPLQNEVCHGDFNPSNIIIANDGTPYIIDWSHATQGSASADVARTYLLFWLGGEITMADKYLDLFCEKADIKKQCIQKWLPIVAAAQMVNGRPEEREFLMHWVNVVDYE